MLTFLISSALALVPLAPHPQVSGPAEIMNALSALELSREGTYRVRDLTLRRDVVSVSFERGVLAFLEPVNGKVTGAVFVGSGDVLALPPDEIERRQVNKFTGSPILNERFDAAILRFTDDTYGEVLDRIRLSAEEDVRADDLEALLPWDENLGNTSRLLNFRLLQDLVGPADRPVFFAAMRGERLGWFDVAYDERSTEEIIMGDSAGLAKDSDVENVWASFNKRAEAGDRRLYGPRGDSDVDVSRYVVDTSIARDGVLSATVTMDLGVERGGERVLPFTLTRSLRLSEVRFEGESIPFFQHDVSDGEFPRGVMDRFVVVLPRPTVEDETLQLQFDYRGSVLERRGNGVYYVSERVFWYPHVGGLDPAQYELNFDFPADSVLVATGNLVEESEVNGRRHSTWISGREFVVAGFNYGDFSVESDETGAVPIYVHVNNDVETVYEDLAVRRAALTESVLRVLQGAWRPRGGTDSRVPVRPDYDLFSTRRLASNAVSQVRSMVDFFSSKLGDYPFTRLSVSQFPVPFSQGWPSLLYVSTLSFFDDEQKARLNLTGDAEMLDLDYVLAHEVAHQWFGNKVAWWSYRDQWVGEGFSNYMAIRYLEEAAARRGATERILGQLKRQLLAQNGADRSNDDNGPVWIGQRLATIAVPNGYVDTVYPKATWIVHMLRMLMRDGGDESDDRFDRMMRAYLEEFDGKLATTWDLKSIAERYMTPRMDAGGDGTLDWFFDQWVFGTGVPDFVLSYDVVENSPGEFVVEGRIEDRQRLGFTTPLPLYAQTRSGEVQYIQDAVVSGDGTTFRMSLPYSPSDVLLDPYGAVLRR